VSLDQCVEALERLAAPDKWSRTQDFGGRRIEDVDGGWTLLNYQKYRDLRDYEERRIQTRDAVRRHRAKLKASGITVSRGKPKQKQKQKQKQISGSAGSAGTDCESRMRAREAGAEVDARPALDDVPAENPHPPEEPRPPRRRTLVDPIGEAVAAAVGLVSLRRGSPATPTRREHEQLERFARQHGGGALIKAAQAYADSDRPGESGWPIRWLASDPGEWLARGGPERPMDPPPIIDLESLR
jgi:hypothetical protein